MPAGLNIAIFGLGYVGAVATGCLATFGHTMIAVDPNPLKTRDINNGNSPIVEPGLEKLIRSGWAKGRIRATDDVEEALADADVCMICVGTPGRDDGSLDLAFVERVSSEIGAALAKTDRYITVMLRSTVVPGTTEGVVIPLLEQSSGKVAGRDFGVVFSPEFLREGSAVADFFEPSKVVIGAHDESSLIAIKQLVALGSAEVVIADFRVAELVKYADNAWHATKVAFANEIGSIARSHEVNGQHVMEIFCLDERLNISPAYLRPGLSFGGSCLPKDVRALQSVSRGANITTPLIDSILEANEAHLNRCLDLIKRFGATRIGMLGISFKCGTDDLRESPLVSLIARLLNSGEDVVAFDSNVRLDRLTGANKAYIERHIPYIGDVLTASMREVLRNADLLVIGHNDPLFATIADIIEPAVPIVDLVGMPSLMGRANYFGIAW